MKNIFEDFGCKCIWFDDSEHVNQYVDFIHIFQLDNVDPQAKLYISVDTEYALFINSSFVDCGPYDDYPEHKSYDVLAVDSFLKNGENRLCVRAHHQGIDSMQYVKGTPMLCYAIVSGDRIIASNSEVICRKSPGYRQGDMDVFSMQLGFSFHYDARYEDNWLRSDYVADSTWKPAITRNDLLSKICFYPRPVKKQEFKEPVKMKLISQGLFQAAEQNDQTLGWRMQRDFLGFRDAEELFENWTWAEEYQPRPSRFPGMLKFKENLDNIYLTLDMGAEEAGLFYLNLNADEGTHIDVCYGEHLHDMRVRSTPIGYNFSFSYVCRQGEQEFTHYFKRIAGRYIHLQISGFKTPVSIKYAGVIPMVYPVEYSGSFVSQDNLTNRILHICDRTLQLCMHEHYEDSPWREQALYGFDSRNQMLSGYYMYNNSDFAFAGLKLLAEHPRKDGLLQNSSPGNYPVTMPSFSLEWILSLRDFVLFTGRTEDAKSLFKTADNVIEAIAAYYDGYLLKTQDNPAIWNFYEWVSGLDDIYGLSQQRTKKAEYDAPLNALFCLALRAMEQMAKWMNEDYNKYSKWYHRIANNFFDAFWVPEEEKIASFITDGKKSHYAELTHAWALLADLIPDTYVNTVRKQLLNKDKELVKSTLSFSFFRYEALLQDIESYSRAVFDEITEIWGNMVFEGATSFWETLPGADDFYGGGSLCHGWSAIPAYFYYAYLLGVRPTSPGFANYSFTPVLPEINLEGIVCTPHGKIHVKIHNEKCEIKFINS